jgi:hypothetical protein
VGHRATSFLCLAGAVVASEEAGRGLRDATSVEHPRTGPLVALPNEDTPRWACGAETFGADVLRRAGTTARFSRGAWPSGTHLLPTRRVIGGAPTTTSPAMASTTASPENPGSPAERGRGVWDKAHEKQSPSCRGLRAVMAALAHRQEVCLVERRACRIGTTWRPPRFSALPRASASALVPRQNRCRPRASRWLRRALGTVGA